MQTNLFEGKENVIVPLAFEVRPKSFDEVIGQTQVIQRLKNINFDRPQHFVFHGPPGIGKTTIAQIFSHEYDLNFISFNAVMSGVPELRKKMEEIKSNLSHYNKRSILFIDEIHRFNKAQQDALLPSLERGDFIFFGATTENPRTCLNKAILSRVKVLKLKKLNVKEISEVLIRSLEIQKKELDKGFVEYISKYSNGDARFALNTLEEFLENPEKSFETINKILQGQNREYDKNSDRHYDVISAFIKSVRGSDVDAAIQWLAVMIDGGEDIEFIARRLIILASEDIGNADPRALQMATSTHYAIKTIGMPEARIILAQAVTYLARAPKSNSSYLAIDRALEYVRNNPTQEVPTPLRNHHPDKKNYKYPHSHENHFVEQTYKSNNEKFFESTDLGYEKLQTDYEKRIKSEM